MIEGEIMDSNYMKRALELAELGRGRTSPNPVVGAVIVKEGRIIGEGYHRKYGQAHAEVEAFNSAVESVEGADMYITLEPCSHYGKTPPCAKAIVDNKIKRVYVGLIDPNPLVSGKGIEIMRKSGVEVITGVMEKECKDINEIFFKYIITHKPFVVLKTAMTLDGKISTYKGDSKWISCEESRLIVHKMRNSLTGIMVGINTILKDNPMLTTRIEDGRNPIRIVVDSNLRISEDTNVLNINQNERCIILTTNKASLKKIEAIKRKGAEIIITNNKNGKVDINNAMEILGDMKIDSILLEGGGELAFSALEAGVVDKVVSFIAPKIIGGNDSKTPVEGKGFEYIKDAIELENLSCKCINKDIMVVADVKKR